MEGPVFGDAQGIDGVTGYGYGDASIRSAIDRLSGAGFESTLDMKQESWKQPKDGVGDQAAGAAFYVGWYDLLNFQDIFGRQGLARGSIAWHIASQECQNLWDPGGGWCMNLMRRGVAVTLGPVREPYVSAFPHGDIFTEALLSGGTVAESYWLAVPHVSWAMVILGDPSLPTLCFDAKTGTGSAGLRFRRFKPHIWRKGRRVRCLILLECVGPDGSSTPAMTATPNPRLAWLQPQDRLSIPALKAGQNAIVRIPSVTAGSDPTGMFRLRLNAQDDQKRSRRIVLEGRIGFSRLTDGLFPKSQMFVNLAGWHSDFRKARSERAD